MTKYSKYLLVNQGDEAWGLTILDAGYTHIARSATYPSKDHPSNYYFTWKNGRVLHEYQVIYITQGEGLFESAHCKLQRVKEGSIIILFPNERHRYKPNAETGWNEYWIGLNGPIMDNFIAKKFFNVQKPLLDIGFKDDLFNLLLDIIEKTKSEMPGYQPLISGAAIHLLGMIHAELANASFDGEDNIRLIIDKARFLLRDYMNRHASPEDIANELQVGYLGLENNLKNIRAWHPINTLYS